jgi:hypothetical protein
MGTARMSPTTANRRLLPERNTSVSRLIDYCSVVGEKPSDARKASRVFFEKIVD